MPCLQNLLIHSVVKEEKVTARNDFFRMSNRIILVIIQKMFKSKVPWYSNVVAHYFIATTKINSNKLRFSSYSQNEINRYFFVCFSNVYLNIYKITKIVYTNSDLGYGLLCRQTDRKL